MDSTQIKRTLYQVLNYSNHSDHEHHFVVAGLGRFDINETKQDAELDVDVWLQTNGGKRIWVTFGNLDLVLGELTAPA